MNWSAFTIVALVAISSLSAAPQKYPLSKREPFVYVGVGWRFVYEVTGSLSENGLEMSQGILLEGDEVHKDRWTGIGGNEKIRVFADLLKRAAKAVEAKKAFKEKVDRIELRYNPKADGLRIIVMGIRNDPEDEPFISTAIPATKARDFAAAVGRVADSYERINAKLNPAQQGADPNRDGAPTD